MRLITGLLLLGVASNGVANSQLPPVLAYYPGCDYQLIKSLSRSDLLDVKLETELFERERSGLLRRIQQEAMDAGAEAVVITDLDLDSKPLRSTSYQHIVKYTYTVDAIMLCDEEDVSERQASGFNQSGQRKFNLSANAQFRPKSITLDISKPYSQSLLFGSPISEDAWQNRTLPDNFSINSDGQLLGVDVNDPLTKVIEVLGYPSAELSLYEDVNTLSYGRQYWLHIKEQELVGVTVGEGLLPYETLNDIPILDGWDGSAWVFEENIQVGASLAEVNHLYGTNKAGAKQVRVAHQNGITTHFELALDASGKTEVAGLTMLAAGQPPLTPIMTKVNYSALVSALSAKDSEAIQHGLQAFAEESPKIARIHQGENTFVDMYDDKLAIQWQAGRVKRIYIRDSNFGLNNTAINWQVTADIKQGETLASLESSVGSALFAMFGEGTINTEHYDLKLFFDGEQPTSSLYAIEATLY